MMFLIHGMKSVKCYLLQCQEKNVDIMTPVEKSSLQSTGFDF